MNFRRKVLVLIVLAVCLSVGAVAWIVSLRTHQAFEAADAERTAALIGQFRREFDRRGQEVVQRIAGIAASEKVTRMAIELGRGAEAAAYLTEAGPEVEAHELDFLEFVAADGTIISSAQWPARFGYNETWPTPMPAKAFLKLEEMPDGPALGLLSVHEAVWPVHDALNSSGANPNDKPIYIIGGERIGRDFLAGLVLPAGMRVLLYRNSGSGFSPEDLLALAPVEDPGKLALLVMRVQQQGSESGARIEWSLDPADSETFEALPLKANDGALLGVLLVGNSRRSLVELQHRIRAVAWLVGGLGILFAIIVSAWVAARVTRPVGQLARAAREVAAGNWNTEVRVESGDELGQLAAAFNRMTRELLQQRERLVQAERVAAWRELARRLAHELKNPLFPAQITVENLVRAHASSPEAFEEVFAESTRTLLAEIANLKAIVGRFSDFSKMPQPQLQPVQVNDLARQVITLHEPQFAASGKPGIHARLELDEALPLIEADPDLLHRVLSNLVLNAMDAMPEGGAMAIRTQARAESISIEVVDTGTGLTPEECERLFTPYYTSKQHGTGLGLAIVQAVVSDHHGSLSVESSPGGGTTFRIELPIRPSTPSTLSTSSISVHD